MALHGCCYRCLKYLVLIFNFLFWLLGLAVVVVALWLYVDTSTYIQLSAKSEDFNKGLFVLIAIGVLMLVVGFLGCCGALKESQCMLCTFFVFLLIILVAEITIVVLAVQNREELTKTFRETITSLVQNEYTNNPLDPRTNLMDEIQKQLECCGGADFQDWRDSKYNGKEGRVELGPLSPAVALVTTFRVPTSCCRRGVSEDVCKRSVEVDPGTSLLNTLTSNSLPQNIYTEGCTEKLITLFDLHREYFVAIALFIAVIELIGMIVSMVLCCAIRRLDDMKV